MEFNEKLQELRKSRGLTQEELAETLYVSRTAVSKWESGRGYPNIDSLKEISKYFSVTIDELICSEEIIKAADKEKETALCKLSLLIASVMDVLLALMLLFVPVYGDGALHKASVSLFMLTDIQQWIKYLFITLIIITGLSGLCGMVICRMDRPVWSRYGLVTGLALMVICSSVFILTRQPYASIICFSILIVRGILMIKMR